MKLFMILRLVQSSSIEPKCFGSSYNHEPAQKKNCISTHPITPPKRGIENSPPKRGIVESPLGRGCNREVPSWEGLGVGKVALIGVYVLIPHNFE